MLIFLFFDCEGINVPERGNINFVSSAVLSFTSSVCVRFSRCAHPSKREGISKTLSAVAIRLVCRKFLLPVRRDLHMVVLRALPQQYLHGTGELLVSPRVCKTCRVGRLPLCS